MRQNTIMETSFRCRVFKEGRCISNSGSVKSFNEALKYAHNFKYDLYMIYIERRESGKQKYELLQQWVETKYGS